MPQYVKNKKKKSNNINNTNKTIKSHCSTCAGTFSESCSSNQKTAHNTCMGTYPPCLTSKEYAMMQCPNRVDTYPEYSLDDYMSDYPADTYNNAEYETNRAFESTQTDYIIGIVEFIGANYDSTGSRYNYRLYDYETIQIGDYVLCETSSMGYRIGILMDVTDDPNAYYIDDCLIKRSIISRLPECDNFINRKLEQRYAKDVF